MFMVVFNDIPIKVVADDRLGRYNFAKKIAINILDYNSDESFVIGIYGEWGSGKTSALNLIKNEIIDRSANVKSKPRYKVLQFNPWNFSNQDQLLEQFFKFLKKELSIIDYSEVLYKNGEFCEKVSKCLKLFNLLPCSGKIGALLSAYSQSLKSLKSNKSIEEIKLEINMILSKQQRKFIILIDDIDRLNDNEIAQVFQLVKLIANFKNILYVLSFDKKVVVSALKHVQSEFAELYLEKIIQFPALIPAPSKKKIQSLLFEQLNVLIEDIKIEESRLYGLMSCGIYDTFTTLRQVKRFLNNFKFSYVPLKKEVDFVDFFIVKYLEVFYYEVYKKLQNEGKLLTGNYSSYSGRNDEVEKEKVAQFISDLLSDVTFKNEKVFLQELLGLLFIKANTSKHHLSRPVWI
jgi:predicted KAP-like P-loop ATPase